MKRGLVVSGGGSKGAFAGGIIEHILKDKKIYWESGSGASTGALLLPLSLMGDIDTLKDGFCNITNEKIYSKNPFKKNGKIKILNAIWRFITSKKSLGEAENLLNEIRRTLTKDKFNALKNSGQNVFITVSNFSTGNTEYINIDSYDYETFTKFMLASASVPIMFDVVEIDNNQYLDGGTLESVPIQKLIDDGCTEIDVIILKVDPKVKTKENKHSNSIIDVLFRTIELMNREIVENDVNVAKLSAKISDVKLNLYYQPTILSENVILFDPIEMKKMWDIGYEYAKKKMFKSITIKKVL